LVLKHCYDAEIIGAYLLSFNKAMNDMVKIERKNHFIVVGRAI